ncbi:class I SAM-dependent methyltransferase [Mycobacterium riyadhense]|uniref:SAM-dependent methyltransferase n=1 Tax=Mycobacterium riyadhense TaxID=486698 RepID=A0A1X2BXW6_9MYCO|nr:class I SAM-dependent methyltransferase [Mycobacterium riyadhense]MCV7149206.1 class I SAM-dependent methyltransferase [Mycobacterium riyadhense]ORW67959.1 SAM-dependent methyltransferase [Mycobacterium riyadhense]VTO95799.1 Trans-aconitate 2-methyltransferase [Mycobacterium riyadhense]
MADNTTTMLGDVARYYASKLEEHGTTARGVDWNGEAGQALRFDQLLRIVDAAGRFSINDLGCGYGALLDYLDARGFEADYTGIDVSPEMARAAALRFEGREDADFKCGTRLTQEADYSVASGIFNVRLERSDAEWQDYIEATLDLLDAASRRGFSFNCLTSYSDASKMRDELYYADPCALFDLCKRRYSKSVALLHDYGLYEFTILVRKAP